MADNFGYKIKKQLLTFDILALMQIFLREMHMIFLPTPALQSLFSRCQEMSASSKAEMCICGT